ncbi:MAG: peptidylprolyl isomerase [Deltaproteobacteria bacterium]|nr:peptidylprolyl isomerase [Deltaproteobacteria bacterium]MBN2672003.1 peptidylprolyl isomerase [Deltaproteobacteria bacterium]
MILACNGNSGKSTTSTTENAPGKAVYPKECPEQFAVKLETTKGDIVIDVTKEWAPLGAQRFWELVNEGFFTDIAFFRVIENFIAQVGIHGDPAANTKWRNNPIQDDPVKQGNEKGTIVFAMGGPNTRTTQIFINLKDNKQLDTMGFAAFGKVRDLDVASSLYSGYGEGAPSGKGPSQMLIQTQGNKYLKPSFPQLDYIKTATILK